MTDFADPENPIVYHEVEGTFVADDGTVLRPGFTSRVGFDNYREVFTSSEFQGPFFRVLAWNLAFAFLPSSSRSPSACSSPSCSTTCG